MKMMIYDGSFRQGEIDWLSKAEEVPGLVEWLELNGLTHAIRFGEFGDLAIDVWVPDPSKPSAAKHGGSFVMVDIGPISIEFVIEKKEHLMSFLMSPLVASRLAERHLAGLHAIAQCSFRAWHGHEPPLDENDHSPFTTCRRCDPEWEETRQRERSKLMERRQNAERR